MSTPLEVRARIEKITLKIETLEADFTAFQNGDERDYLDWYEAIFGEYERHIQERREEQASLTRIISQMWAESAIHGIGLGEAVTRLKHEEYAYERGTEATREEIDRERERRWAYQREQWQEDEPPLQLTLAFDTDEVGEFEDYYSVEIATAYDEPGPQPQPHAQPPSEDLALLNRQLSNKLETHAGPWQPQLTKRVKDAFNTHDGPRLKALWHLVQLRTRGAELSQLELEACEEALLAELTRLNKKAKAMRRDPAWRFSKRLDVTALRRKIERPLKRELEMLDSSIEDLREQIDELEQENPRVMKNA